MLQVSASLVLPIYPGALAQLKVVIHSVTQIALCHQGEDQSFPGSPPKVFTLLPCHLVNVSVNRVTAKMKQSLYFEMHTKTMVEGKLGKWYKGWKGVPEGSQNVQDLNFVFKKFKGCAQPLLELKVKDVSSHLVRTFWLVMNKQPNQKTQSICSVLWILR